MKIGNLEIRGDLVLAPMAGVTDLAFRTICAELGAAVTVTEMVSSRALIYQDKKSRSLLHRTPIGVCGAQIFGNDPSVMAEGAALALEASGADFIDINMGCPMPKIVNNGDGSALMKDPELAGRIVEAVVKAVKLPVTVKFRAGWDSEHINAVEFAKICEDAGAAALTVHGRTRMQMFGPPVDLEIIRLVKEAVSIPVIGNGDVDSGPQAAAMFDRYGVDGVMIGRATYGRPWIFREVRHYLTTGEVLPQPTVVERVEIAKRHLRKSVEIKGEYVGVLEMRRHLSNYFKGLPDFKQNRLQIVTLTDIPALMATLDSIAERWGDFDTSQVVPAPLSHEL